MTAPLSSSGLYTEMAETLRGAISVIRKAAIARCKHGMDSESVFNEGQIKLACDGLRVLARCDEENFTPSGRDVVLMENLGAYVTRAKQEIMEDDRANKAVQWAVAKLSQVGEARDHYGASVTCMIGNRSYPQSPTLRSVIEALCNGQTLVRSKARVMVTQGYVNTP